MRIKVRVLWCNDDKAYIIRDNAGYIVDNKELEYISNGVAKVDISLFINPVHIFEPMEEDTNAK